MSESGLVIARPGAPDLAQPEPLLTSKEVADWLQMSESWVRERALGRKRPSIPCVRFEHGGKSKIRFDRRDLERWLDGIKSERAKRNR